MRYSVLIMVLVFLPAVAGESILDIFIPKSQVFDLQDIQNITAGYKQNTKTIQKSHIVVSGDIVGYKNMIKKDEIFYVPEPLEDNVIFVCDINHIIKGKQYWNYNVDRLSSKKEYIVTDSVFKVILTVELKYHKSKRINVNGKPRNKKTYYREVEKFEFIDSNPPAEYPRPQNNTVELLYYNNTIQPKTISRPNLLWPYTKIEYRYKNESILYRDYIYKVEYTEKNVPYGNLTLFKKWDYADNEKIYSFNDVAWIPGHLDKSNLSVIMNTPYNSTPAKINITEYPDITQDFPIWHILATILPIFCIALIMKVVFSL